MSKLIAGILKNILPWAKDSIFGWVNKWIDKRKRNSRVDNKLENLRKAVEAMDEKPTPEQEKAIVDAGRALIDIDNI